MSAIEITLLLLGAIIFVISFVLPEQKKQLTAEQQKFSENEVKKVVEQQMEHVKDRVEEVVDETIEYTIDKTERSLAKVSNEKIMAVNEYSDTVLEEINKNHKEVMFLYDMLNDKQTELHNIVRKIEATKDEAVSEVARAAENAASTAAKQTAPIQMSRAEQAPIPEELPEQIYQEPTYQEPTYQEPIFHRFAEGIDIPVLQRTEQTSVQEIPVAAVAKKQAGRKPAAEKTSPAKQKAEKTVPAKTEARPQSAAGSRNNNSRILAMHKEGKSDIDIAKELGLGLGEVKLVIDLFKGA